MNTEYVRYDKRGIDATDFLGPCGRLLWWSKGGYSGMYPDRQPIFNANVYTTGPRKLWYGDLDLAVPEDRESLTRLARAIGQPIYVLREMDGRFDKELAPDLGKAVEVFSC